MPRTRRKNLETGDKSREPNACIRIGNSWEATRDSQPNPRRKRGYTLLRPGRFIGPTVAIAVRTFDGRNTHVGIAYCAEDNNEQMHLIHLAWHCMLEVETAFDPISSGYLCLIPRLPRSMMEAVASRCRSTAIHKPKLRYGFLAQQDAHIDADGHYFVRDDHGQNCSSFV